MSRLEESLNSPSACCSAGFEVPRSSLIIKFLMGEGRLFFCNMGKEVLWKGRWQREYLPQITAQVNQL